VAISGSINERYDVARAAGFRVRDLDDRGLGGVGRVLQEIVFKWREELQRSWPRATGLSFASWESFVSGVVIVTRNPVEYAAYVHPSGTPAPQRGERGRSSIHVDQYMQRLIREEAPTLRRIAKESKARLEEGAAARAVLPTRETSIDLFGALAAAFQARGGYERQAEFFGAAALRDAVTRTRQSETQTALGATVAASRLRNRERQRSRTR